MSTPDINIHCIGCGCPLNDICLRHKYFRLGGRLINGLNIMMPRFDEEEEKVFCDYFYSEITGDVLTKFPEIINEN